MRLIYNNEIDNYTITSSDYAGSEHIHTNIQDTRLGKTWRTQNISNKFENGDCESALSPTLDGTPSGLANATWARSAVEVQEGSFSWVLTKTSAAAAGDSENYLNDLYSETSDMHGLLVNKSYRIDFYMFSDVGTLTNAELTIQEYYAAAWHDVVTFNPSQASTWENHVSTFRFNSSTTGIRIYQKIASAEVLGKLIYFDDFKLYLEPRIILDVGSGNTINPTASVILNHNLSSGANIRLQGNASEDWSSPAVDEALTWNSENILDFISASGLRFWSFLFDDYDNSDGYVEIGRLFLGGYTEISGNAQYNLPKDLNTMSSSKQNQSGQLFGKDEVDLKSFRLNFSRWSQTDHDNFITFWNSVKTHTPFIIVLKNSLLTIFPSLYCHMIDNPDLTYVFTNFWSAAFEIRKVN